MGRSVYSAGWTHLTTGEDDLFGSTVSGGLSSSSDQLPLGTMLLLIVGYFCCRTSACKYLLEQSSSKPCFAVRVLSSSCEVFVLHAAGRGEFELEITHS